MKIATNDLSTIIVDTLVDENDGDLSTGDVSLREALSVVEAGGTIEFAEGLADADAGFGQGVIGLTLSELVVDKSVIIRGLGADKLTISGNGESRVFRLDDDDSAITSNVRLEGLMIADGEAEIAGGVLTAGENVTFVDMALSGNRGAIATTAAANISVEQSSIFNSKGFGIDALGELRLTDTQIINSDGNGIGHNGQLTLERSWVTNSADSGIVAEGRLALIDSQVASNGADGIRLSAGVSAGEISLQNSAVTGNQENGIAGATAASGAGTAVSVVLTSSTVESNGADGVMTLGNTLVENSSVANNGGNGIVSDDVTISRGLVLGNGGTGVLGRVVEISDSEIFNNVGGNVVRTVSPVVDEPEPDTANPDVVTIDGNREANVLRGTEVAEIIRGYAGDDRINGKAGNDVLEGGNGDDQMVGGSGDDVLGGGRGRDLMRGGAGKDTFVYTEIIEGGDIIIDFEVGRDLIDLSAILASTLDETGYESAQPFEDQLFEDYVQLSRSGAGTTVSVLDAARSTTEAPVFQTLALLKTVELSDITASSFVL